MRLASLMGSGFRPPFGAGQWLGLLTATVLLGGCAPEPAGRDSYAGEPVRAAIVEGCTAELIGADSKPCVQIDVFAEGKAEEPEAKRGDWVGIHYIVEVDGNAIDSSHDKKPLRFKLGESNDIIDGMHRGVMGMRVGERRRFTVPPKLGYRGQKVPGVPPEANLVFFVELMDRRDAS